jgi:hypothetical protein
MINRKEIETIKRWERCFFIIKHLKLKEKSNRLKSLYYSPAAISRAKNKKLATFFIDAIDFSYIIWYNVLVYRKVFYQNQKIN